MPNAGWQLEHLRQVAAALSSPAVAGRACNILSHNKRTPRRKAGRVFPPPRGKGRPRLVGGMTEGRRAIGSLSLTNARATGGAERSEAPPATVSGCFAIPEPAHWVDLPPVQGALDAGVDAVPINEMTIGLGLAAGVEVGGLVAGWAAAHDAGPPATARTGDGEDRVGPGGEVDHQRRAPRSHGAGGAAGGVVPPAAHAQNISGGSHAATRARCSAGISVSGWNRVSRRAHFSPFFALAKVRASVLSASIPRSSHHSASR